ncbi:MAG: PEP-CTERM sorting domain-containing protein [Methylacidiphilales bacterium]|nr:PEP-CTERM sorting domain-containing protein [Candidatus Methylacidiphilales bacterium]
MTTTKKIKKLASFVLVGCLAFTGSVWGANSNIITYTVQNDGSGNTLLTWTVTGGITTSGVGYDVSSPFFNGVMIQANGIFNGSDFSSDMQSIGTPDGSYFQNVNTSTNSPIDYYQAIHSTTDSFGLEVNSSDFNSPSGETVKYVAGTQSVDLSLSFALFNPGTYSITYTPTHPFAGSFTANLDVIASPEPGTVVLLSMGMIGLLALARKRQSLSRL